MEYENKEYEIAGKVLKLIQQEKEDHILTPEYVKEIESKIDITMNHLQFTMAD